MNRKDTLKEALHVKDGLETIRLPEFGVKSAPYTNREKFCKHVDKGTTRNAISNV